MVGIGRIKIIDSPIDGIADHLHSLCFIDPGIIILQHREAHASKAQWRDPDTRIAKFDQFHR